MKRNRLLAGIAIAVLVGLFASRYVYNQLQKAASVKPLATDRIVVAAVPLPLGMRLQASQLRTIAWPLGERPAGSFFRIEDCVGRALITPVVGNEAILDAKLAPREAGAGLPAAIPEGSRAVSVRVDDVVAVAGFAMPGTMVDVLVTGDVQGAAANSNSVTRTILEDVRVLAAGQQVTQDKDGKPQTVNVVTLLVDPEQANKLTMASTEGKIHLSLRNTIDSKEANPAAVFKSSLFGGTPPVVRTAGGPKPAPKPANYVVEVIRGNKRESQTFPAQ
jgi:pilus assembly protein CpaB